MVLRILGMMIFLLNAKIKTISKRKIPATIKKPAAMLLSKPPNHQPNPKKVKNIKKKKSKKATMPMAIPDTAFDAPDATLAFVNCMYVLA